MPSRQRLGASRGPSAPPGPDDTEAYRLVAIRPAATPAGCAGRDWLVYEIAQGINIITGYRRGDLQSATADVERIVIALNERRVKNKGRPGPKPKHVPSAAAPAAAAASNADRDGDQARGDGADGSANGSDAPAADGEAEAGDEDDSA